MGKATVALSILEVLLKWGGRIAEALRDGDEKKVDDVLGEQPRIDKTYHEYLDAKRAKFGPDEQG